MPDVSAATAPMSGHTGCATLAASPSASLNNVLSALLNEPPTAPSSAVGALVGSLCAAATAACRFACSCAAALCNAACAGPTSLRRSCTDCTVSPSATVSGGSGCAGSTFGTGGNNAARAVSVVVRKPANDDTAIASSSARVHNRALRAFIAPYNPLHQHPTL